MSVALVSRLKIYYLKNGSKFKFVCMLFDTYVIFRWYSYYMHGLWYISKLRKVFAHIAKWCTVQNFWSAQLSSPHAKRAGPKGLRAESARAVTGRGTPTGGRGEDFLSRQPIFFTETAVTRKFFLGWFRWESCSPGYSGHLLHQQKSQSLNKKLTFGPKYPNFGVKKAHFRP